MIKAKMMLSSLSFYSSKTPSITTHDDACITGQRQQSYRQYLAYELRHRSEDFSMLKSILFVLSRIASLFLTTGCAISDQLPLFVVFNLIDQQPALGSWRYVSSHYRAPFVQVAFWLAY